MHVRLDEDPAQSLPRLFPSGANGLAWLEASAERLAWPLVTVDGEGSFDRVVASFVHAITEADGICWSAYALWLERRPDTPLNRRLGMFVRRAESFTPSDADIQAHIPEGDGRLLLGALVRLPDLTAFREQVLFTRRGRPVTVVLPVEPGGAASALDRLLATQGPLRQDPAWWAPSAAVNLLDLDCCVLRIWLDDVIASVDVFGPTERVIALDAVVRPLLAGVTSLPFGARGLAVKLPPLDLTNRKDQS